MSHETVEPYEYLEHCKDCCCARSWKALGVTTYTGMSIVEHIEQLATQNDALRTQARALAEAIETIIKIRNGPHALSRLGKCTDMWREAEYVSQTAQAILKERE